MKPVQFNVVESLYAFTEIEGNIASFRAKNPHLRILAERDDKALVFFGHSGLEVGATVDVPEGWRDLLGPTFTWPIETENP